MDKGHFLQNTPYLYGYTGNMIHRIFSDWTSFSIQSNINIHDIYSKTGLVRGSGLYTNNKLTFGDTQINIFNIGAAIDLYQTDTKQLNHPYSSKYYNIDNDINNDILYL